MAIVEHSSLPAFWTMESEGYVVASPDDAASSPLADLTIGLLNLMPDAALRATDRQFLRLLAAGSDEYDIWLYPFTAAAEWRGDAAAWHVEEHYTTFEDVQRHGLDALIVTGANPAEHRLEREHFWDELGEVLDWASAKTKSVLCSCLATHAVLQKYRSLIRTRLPEKRWGVYQHERLGDHPLLEGLGDTVEAPHSHWYDVTRDEMESVGLRVLLESEEAGVHMAVDDEQGFVFFQGHPEYDQVSLLKEYRRELGRFFYRDRDDYPPVPEHYFDDRALDVLAEYRPILEACRAARLDPPRLSEDELTPHEKHVWMSEGQIIYRNWLRQIASEK
jgi:homoserine O-succinyltransferase